MLLQTLSEVCDLLAPMLGQTVRQFTIGEHVEQVGFAFAMTNEEESQCSVPSLNLLAHHRRSQPHLIVVTIAGQIAETDLLQSASLERGFPATGLPVLIASLVTEVIQA